MTRPSRIAALTLSIAVACILAVVLAVVLSSRTAPRGEGALEAAVFRSICERQEDTTAGVIRANRRHHATSWRLRSLVTAVRSQGPSSLTPTRRSVRVDRLTREMKELRRESRALQTELHDVDCARLPPGVTSAITEWRPPGSAPLTDADAARRVVSAPETRRDNAAANAYVPSAAELAAYRRGQVDRYDRTAVSVNPRAARVTGNFKGTTDEIIQWASIKWGIPEEIARAQAVTESNWHQNARGDLTTVADASLYPAHTRMGAHRVYESLGVMQARWNPDADYGHGTEPLRWKSTAFNLDYWGATVRYYYDGDADWASPGYAAGQEWDAIGGWFSPVPWGHARKEYIPTVKRHLADRPWRDDDFGG